MPASHEVPKDRELLTRKDICRMTGLSLSTVKRFQNRTDEKHLPAVRIGRLVRTSREDFEAWKAKQPYL